MKKSELKYKNWMVTILTDKENKLQLPPAEEVERVFNEESEKWLFQEEEHENSEVKKTHYQCCLVTKIRKRKNTILKNLADALEHPIEYIRIEKMEGTWEQAMLYCSKSEGRVGETIKSAKICLDYDFTDVEFLNDPSRRYPWQEEILAKLFTSAPSQFKIDEDLDRQIIWIYDEHGNSGKSKLVKWICSYNDLAVKISFGTSNQLRAGIISAGVRRLYLMDVPRTLGTEDNMNDVLSLLEDLKNGHVVSSFYGNYTKLVMTPPLVVVFSNQRCPVAKLSSDRWLCYTIVDKKLRYSFENIDYIEKGLSLSHEGVSRNSEIDLNI